ncbi:kelch-like protein 5 [Liolophura sinensis]|uniref:kelch-like protein 5 n=1 Tax=Liolophura sinensis TaxID=3198878 RepID=UPI003158266D
MAIKQNEVFAKPSAPSEIQPKMNHVIINVNGQPVQCPTRVLTTISLHLVEVVRVASSNETQVNIVTEPEVMDIFVNYLRTGHCILKHANLNLLTYAAYKYKMPSLLARCERMYLSQLIPMNCLENWLFAESHGCDNLAREAFRMALEHFQTISKTQQFCHIGKSQLLRLVLDQALVVDSPNNVFRAIDRWSKYEENVRTTDKEEICRQYSDLLYNRVPQNTPRGVPLRDSNVCFDTPAPKRRRSLSYQSQRSVTSVVSKQISLQEEITAPDPTVVCLAAAQDGVEMIQVTLSEKSPKMTTTAVPSSTGLSKDSAFCHTFDGIYGSGGDLKPNGTTYYDLEAKEWQKQTKMFYNGRRDHMLCYLNERLYVIGGINNNSDRVFEYIDKFNVKTKTWSHAGKLQEQVKSAACVAFGRDIYVFGGIRPDGFASKTVQRYNPASKKTEVVNQIPCGGLICHALTDRNLIYLMSSTGKVLTFSPHTGDISNLASFRKPVTHFGAAHHNGFLYIFGGKLTKASNGTTLSSEMYRLDLRKKDSPWQLVSSLPHGFLVLSCSEAMMGVG